jgi:SAM-dependent methyltransferase
MGLRQAAGSWSRRRKLREFFTVMHEGATVLDVGVTSMDAYSPETNIFLKRYPYNPSTYCGLGIEPMESLQRSYPGFRFEQYGGGRMPFRDREFDFAFSNAVIEHVGRDEAQVLFLSEMLRVARRIYFTTPNRWFPIEAHSMQVLRHWSRRRFDAWARANHQDWLTYPELNLLGKGDIVQRLREAGATKWAITSNRLLGWPITYSAWAQTL